MACDIKRLSVSIVFAALCVTFFGAFLCDPGPKRVQVNVSEGTTPSISWKAKRADQITVCLLDTLAVFCIPYARSGGDSCKMVERHPVVWGYAAISEDEYTDAVISSPVYFGKIPEGAIDLSDPGFRTAELLEGRPYEVYVTNPGVWYARKRFRPYRAVSAE